ncbi:MAG: B12-binding domain-containing radical SAM protein [Chloroflexota bacterium]|nr:B12-binding domain-containing radical SAM protein [Chloroflexota bacterium]
MSHILFGQSYYLRFDPKLWAAMQPYPPLGTLYAASYLRERGYNVGLFDAMLAESEAEWEQALERERPHVAVIYEDNFNYLSKMCLLRMREAAYTMIDMARQRGCTVIVCGSDATDHAESYLAQGADFVLLGEGEETLGELMDRLVGRTSVHLSEISGLAYRETASDSSYQPVRNPRRRDIKNPDALPFPAWDLVDVERYKALWYERHGYYSMNMVTTRGCPYHCNWCAKPIWGQRYNVRSPENVVAELKWLKERYQPDHIWFADDIVGLKPGWWPRFAHLVEQESVQIPFKCLSRVDLLLRDDDIPALKRAGCEIVWVGAESGSQKILNAMEKGTKVEQIYEAARRLREVGVKVGFFLQFGYPGETREDIEQTLQMVRECEPDDIGMSVSYPLPGTTFHERVKDQLGTKQNWKDSSDLAMLYEGPFTTEFYRQLHTVLHKEYRARKSWRNLKELFRQPGDFQQAHLRHAAAMLYHTVTLPLARRKLNQLEAGSPNALGPLEPAMDQEAAATPSPQQ